MPEMAVKPTTPTTRTGRILADFVRDSGNADLVEDIEEEAALAERMRLLRLHVRVRHGGSETYTACPDCHLFEAGADDTPDSLRRDGVL